MIFKASKDPEFIHLIVQGVVKLVAAKNPFAQPHINEEEDVDKTEANLIVQNTSTGLGAVSPSIAQNQLGFQGPNTWIGDEALLLNVPVIYDAIAASKDVRIFKVSKADLKAKLPSDVFVQMEKRLMPRLQSMRERLADLHDTRSEILRMDKKSNTLQETINHMEVMYPNSTKSLQRKFRLDTLGQSGGNSALLLFSDNRSKDKARLNRAGNNANQDGREYKSFREKLNSASKRRMQI